MNPVTHSFQYGNDTITLETGRIARQATGSVMVTMGNTSVLCTVVAKASPKPGQSFFPLSVHYQEKAYAAGYQAASDYFGAVVSYSDPVPYPANMIPVPQT